MKLAASSLAIVAACAASPPRVEEPDAIAAEYEVHIPTSPYAPLASVLPGLHTLAFKVCPGRYDIVDRRMKRTQVSLPAYDFARRRIVPSIQPWGEIVATVRCYAR